MTDEKTSVSSSGALAKYLHEINGYPLITREEEVRLAKKFRRGDAEAGQRLVTANLRFVVKIAYKYRSYGLRMADLIQEGNIGLMKAVTKFDPDLGNRLISYAVWWIRAYIQNFIMMQWSLVKLGTTQAQRKLFFSLAKARKEIEHDLDDKDRDDMDLVRQKVAKKLNVKVSEVEEMERRMNKDLSMDAPVSDGSGVIPFVAFLPDENPLPEELLADRRLSAVRRRRIEEALRGLDPRERFIIEQRVMNERPMTLKELGEHFGFSRERARQLEIRAKDKLKEELLDLATLS